MNRTRWARFKSVEELEAALRPVSEVEITQSDSGSGSATFWSTSIGGCLVFGGTGNRAMVFSGRRSEEYWTLTPIRRLAAGGHFRGQVLEEGDLLLLDPGGEVFQRTLKGHLQHAISIPLTVAQRIIAAEHGLAPESVINKWSRKNAPRAAGQLERMLMRLLAGNLPSRIGGNADVTEVAGQVIATSLSGSSPQSLRSSLANRRRIVSRAEELIRGSLNQPPGVTELCEATYASRRLLFNAFNELLGRSPIAHAKILRLHAARRRIRSGDERMRIQEIAFQLGFSHLGQFATDYSRLFGELPSQTRRLWGGFSAGDASVLLTKTARQSPGDNPS